MQGQKKKFLVFTVAIGFFIWGVTIQTGYAQKSEVPFKQMNPIDLKLGFIQSLTQSITFWAAHLAFDYNLRPVIGILISDFSTTSGEEIALGNEIASELRVALSNGKQFHVYGKEQPVSQSLKKALVSDPQWRASSQKKFQQDLSNKFKAFPVDLVITGQVSKETEDQLKIEVSLISFYKPINIVEKERTDIHREKFISPVLSSQEIADSLSVVRIPTVPKGRLVVVSLMNLDKGKSLLREYKSSLDTATQKTKNDITCWLDDKELAVFKEWQDFKKKEYHDILSGVGADTIWFDDSVEEGPHSIFFSLTQGPPKNRYKTFLKSFIIKGETSNYLFFTIQPDSQGEQDVRVRHIIDPENRSIPF